MVLREKKSTVKGTTRVSFNDRQLVRKLYSADKNSRQSKQKRKREESKEDKERLFQAPHRRSQEAFNAWAKKAKQGDFLFECRDTDDKVAVKAMCLSQWDDLLQRRDRLHELVDVFEEVRKNVGKNPVNPFLAKLGTLLLDQADLDMPLLTGKKHSRAKNYRKKVLRRAELFSRVPCPKRPSLDYKSKEKTKTKKSSTDDKFFEFQSSRNLCEPLPKCDYEDCDENVFYVCSRCNNPVQATRMVVKASGSFDAYFFHPECSEQ